MSTDLENKDQQNLNPSDANYHSTFDNPAAKLAEAESKESNKAPADGTDDSLQGLEDANPMGYTEGISPNMMAGFSAAGFAAGFVNGVTKNKFKLIGGGGIAGIIIAGLLFSSTLALPFIKNNAETKLSGVTNSVLDSYGGTLLQKLIKKVGRSSIKASQLNSSADELAKTLETKGYELVDDTKLKLPGGEIIEGTSAIEGELRGAAKAEFGSNWRTRSKLAKVLRKRATLSTISPTDDAVAAADETRAGPASDVIADARADTFTPDKTPDGAFPQVEEADNVLASEVSSDAKKTKEKLLANGSSQADDVVTDVANNGLDVAAAAGASEEAALGAGGGVLGKLSLSSYLSQEVCGVAKKVNLAYTASLIAKKVNLIRLSGVIINAADSQITGRNDPKLLNKLLGTIQTNPSSGKNMFQSEGLGFITGSSTAKPSDGSMAVFGANRLDVGSFLGVLVAIYNRGYIKSTCQFATSNAGQLALTAAEIGGTVFTGGGLEISVQALKEALKQGIKSSIPYVAGSIGFYFVGQFAAKYVEKAALGMLFSFNKSEGGPTSGNAIASGLGANAEMTGRNSGMQPVTRSSYVDMMKIARQEQHSDYAKKSLYERFAQVDARHTDSLLAQVAIGSPLTGGSVGSIISNTVAAITNFSPLNQAATFASTALSSSAYAQDGNVTVDDNGYVTDPWGNYIVGNNFEGIDPIVNMNSLYDSKEISSTGEPVAGTGLSKYIDDCLQIEIREDSSNKVKSKCTDGSSKKYQAYLATYNNLDGMYAALHPVIGEPDSSNSSAQPSTTVGDPGVDTSGLKCPADTDDGSIEQDYGPGRVATVKIKLCGIPGSIPVGSGVNASTAANALAMINSAKTAGISLSGTAFRSYDVQKKLRIAHKCADDSIPPKDCTVPTARPGDSMHEVGLAIDFRNCSARSTACYQWLNSNAANFGFKNLPSEAWHWSTTGG